MRERWNHSRAAAALLFVVAIFMAAASSRGQTQTPTASPNRGTLTGAVTADQGAVV